MKMMYVINILSVISLIVSIPFLWNFLIPFIGTVKRLTGNRRKDKLIDKRMNRFAVVTCARDEAAVIGKLLDSLGSQDYPRELYDIYVIADNCTDDKTAEQALLHGAYVLSRFDKTRVGKGYALKWGFEKIFSEYPEKYDAVCVFDADNLADKGFLSAMNDSINCGADGAQGYRRSSNPHDSIVSGCYEIYWMMINRFQNLARHELGMSCLFSGTGFVIRSEYVKNGGWSTDTITEDTEFSVENIIKGRRIHMAEKAVFYDEQPTLWGVSVTQRFRWMFGAMQCALKIFNGELKKKTADHRRLNLHTVDMYMWLLSVPAMAVMLFIEPARIMLLFLGGYTAMGIMSLMLSLMSFPVISLFCCKESIKRMWRSALIYPVFVLPMAFMALLSLFRKKLEWKPIRHKNTKSLTDMKL